MKLFVIIFIICIFLSSFLIEAKEKKEASINIKKFFTTSQKNIFEDFIKCLTSNEYRNPKNNVKLFF